MRAFDAAWIAYRADTTPTWAYEYQAIIDGQTYAASEIWNFNKTGALAPDNFGIGNCVGQTLVLAVAAKTGIAIPRNASVQLQVRINGSSGPTAWHSLGRFFIEARTLLDGGKLNLVCMDRMAYADVPYLTDGEALEDYPMPMDEAMTRIYAALGTTLDPRSTISHTKTIEYPNDLTMRQVLGFIASAHGGNFVITEEDLLRLVIPSYAGSPLAAIHGGNALKTYAGDTPVTWDSLAMIYTEAGAYYESGTTSNAQLEVTNPWATQAICDAVQAIINGYTYAPYTAEQADLDPAIELGDYITIDGQACQVWSWAWNTRLYCDIRVPSTGDTTTSEFGFTGTLTNAISKKVTLNAAYFGAMISRSQGLKIERSDGTSEVVLNSEMLAMRALEGGTMTDKLYFDPVRGTFIFDGLVEANAIQAESITGDKIAGQTITTDKLIVGGQNMLVDVDSFEQYPAGAVNLASSSAAVTIEDAAGEAYHGTKCIRVQNLVAATASSVWLQPNGNGFLKLPFLGRYLVSCWVRTNTGYGVDVSIQTIPRQGTTTTTSTTTLPQLVTKTINSTLGWVRLVCPIDVTSLADNPHFTGRFLALVGDNQINKMIYWDAFQVEYIGQRTDLIPATFTPGGQTKILGDNITTGTIRSAGNESWLNLNNGTFSFANGRLTFAGTTLDLIGEFRSNGAQGYAALRYGALYFYNNSDVMEASLQTSTTDVTLAPAGGRNMRIPATTVTGKHTPVTNNLYTLGDATYKWSSVWAVNGTIQTSARKDKKNIGRVVSAKARAKLGKLKKQRGVNVYASEYGQEYSGNTSEELIALLDKIADSLVTFTYAGEGGTQQLGTIADDIAGEPGYDQIGETYTDEDGTKNYGLKPLAVAMLAIAGYRENRDRLAALETRIQDLEKKLK